MEERPSSDLNKCCAKEIKNMTNDINCCVEEVGDVVQKLVRVFQLFERDQIKVHGFTSTQCYCLIELSKHHILTMNELSSKMNLTSSTMTRIIDTLVRDQLVFRDRHEEDRRIVIVGLTDKGKEASETLNDSIQGYYRDIIKNIPEGQVLNVLNATSILLDAFEKANPNCC